MSAGPPLLDRHTTMGELSHNVRSAVHRGIAPAGGLFALAACWLVWRHSPGLTAFILMATGALLGLKVWASAGIGVPILPMFLVQQLIVYGLPIVSGHEVVAEYPESLLTTAGLEVLIFILALTAGWKAGMSAFRPGPPIAHVLTEVTRSGMQGLARIGFLLVGLASLCLVITSLGYLDLVLSLLPAGSYPIFMAATAAASGCGFFLLSLLRGTGDLKPGAQIAFWVLLVANCLISASSLLLSSASVALAAAVIGQFWSNGRAPWRFVLIAAVLVSFLNTGKYTMRGRYWDAENEDRPARSITFGNLPSFYAEWTSASWEALLATPDKNLPLGIASSRRNNQSLLQRLNNLQNILYVIDAIESQQIPTLGGASYSVIPPLLIPRILWPNKPRSHEGQILLNVHFGRQLLESTYATYIAWGLLAEAEGNFGPIKGAILVGLILGLFFAWCENYTARKPLLSTEGFVFFAIFLGLASSYEMVASVLITSIFQAIIPIIGACMPFVQRQRIIRPEM